MLLIKHNLIRTNVLDYIFTIYLLHSLKIKSKQYIQVKNKLIQNRQILRQFVNKIFQVHKKKIRKSATTLASTVPGFNGDDLLNFTDGFIC